MIYRVKVDNRQSLSKEISQLVKKSQVESGFVVVQGTSAASAVLLSSSLKYADESLSDLERELTYLIPSKKEFLSKDDPELVSSILKSTLIGTNTVLPIHNGELVLGEKEDIYYLDFYDKQNSEIIISIN